MGPSVDGILVQWGERLFYPRTRIVKTAPLPRLDAMARRRAAEIRARIVATVARRAPQVMVKVTGGGRGMVAIAAHFRYISKNGRLEMEDDRQMTHEGPDALKDIVEQWRYGGSQIGETSHRREAFNLILSMPAGTRPDLVQMAAREFAQVELAGHRWLMVLHEHQANPHVHLSVRAEAINGDRLNPARPISIAGVRPSPRNCAAWASTPRPHARPRVARRVTTRPCGGSRRRKRDACATVARP